MRVLLSAIFALAIFNCSGQTRLDSMILLLKQSQYYKIAEIREGIINHGKEAIPQLIELLKDTSFVKLQHTADLIYPGAEKFYGHGGIVNYDIDWISVRAAWILEEITFEDFGYVDMEISEEKLMKLHQQNYNSYLRAGSHEVNFKDKTPPQKLAAYRLMLADSVSKWWDKNKREWTRLEALKDALASNEIQKQRLALRFLRFGKTRCEGLNLDRYTKELKPLVETIKNSKSQQSRQAELLLEDKEYYWLKIKDEKS